MISHSMENLAFHSLLRKDDYTTSLIHLSSKDWEMIQFEAVHLDAPIRAECLKFGLVAQFPVPISLSERIR